MKDKYNEINMSRQPLLVFIPYLLMVFYWMARFLGFTIFSSLLIIFTVFMAGKIVNTYYKEQMTAIKEHYGVIEIDSDDHED